MQILAKQYKICKFMQSTLQNLALEKFLFNPPPKQIQFLPTYLLNFMGGALRGVPGDRQPKNSWADKQKKNSSFHTNAISEQLMNVL